MKPKKPKWAEYVTFTIDVNGSPMIIARLPREGKWSDVRQQLYNIVYSFGGQRKDLLALDGMCNFPDYFSEEDLSWPANKFYKESDDHVRPKLEEAFLLKNDKFPEFYLYSVAIDSFNRIRDKL